MMIDTDAIAISPRQRTVHVVTEAASVLLYMPFLFYLATRRSLPSWARVTAGLMGLGVLAVDGGLILTWLKRGQGEGTVDAAQVR